jgi:hypothetical protein
MRSEHYLPHGAAVDSWGDDGVDFARFDPAPRTPNRQVQLLVGLRRPSRGSALCSGRRESACSNSLPIVSLHLPKHLPSRLPFPIRRFSLSGSPTIRHCGHFPAGPRSNCRKAHLTDTHNAVDVIPSRPFVSPSRAALILSRTNCRAISPSPHLPDRPNSLTFTKTGSWFGFDLKSAVGTVSSRIRSKSPPLEKTGLKQVLKRCECPS